MSEYSSCFISIPIILQIFVFVFLNGTSKYQEKNVFFSFYTAFPLRFTNAKSGVFSQ